MTLTRRQSQCLSAIRTHFRETGCPPSNGDIGNRLKISRQAAYELKRQLRDKGLITFIDGEALSTRMVQQMANFSNDDLLCQMTAITEELMARGLDVSLASVSVALKKEFPLTIMEHDSPDQDADILAQLEGGDGQEDGTETACATGRGVSAGGENAQGDGAADQGMARAVQSRRDQPDERLWPEGRARHAA
jgi:hypothetical protein